LPGGAVVDGAAVLGAAVVEVAEDPLPWLPPEQAVAANMTSPASTMARRQVEAEVWVRIGPF
jgi:hypothetical protein